MDVHLLIYYFLSSVSGLYIIVSTLEEYPSNLLQLRKWISFGVNIKVKFYQFGNRKQKEIEF